jgi:hypothetical protein
VTAVDRAGVRVRDDGDTKFTGRAYMKIYPKRGTTKGGADEPIAAITEATKLRLVLGALSAALILGLSSAAWSQETTAPAADGSGGFGFENNDKDPIEISAENGIEWKRDARTYTARGNALAQQGDTSIAADTLIAYLDDQDELSNWEAIGNVKIQTGQSTSYGDHATYQESSRLWFSPAESEDRHRAADRDGARPDRILARQGRGGGKGRGGGRPSGEEHHHSFRRGDRLFPRQGRRSGDAGG